MASFPKGLKCVRNKVRVDFRASVRVERVPPMPMKSGLAAPSKPGRMRVKGGAIFDNGREATGAPPEIPGTAMGN